MKGKTHTTGLCAWIAKDWIRGEESPIRARGEDSKIRFCLILCWIGFVLFCFGGPIGWRVAQINNERRVQRAQGKRIYAYEIEAQQYWESKARTEWFKARAQ